MKRKYWDDWLNPVIVKEMRQYFNNKILLAIMALLLTGNFLVLLYATLNYAGENNSYYSAFSGNDFVIAVFIMLSIVVFLICGFGTLIRYTNERSNSELDFGRITTISANQIVGGKTLSGLIMMMFIASLCLPFLVVGYFLRGVSLPNVLLAFVFLLCFGVGILLWGILCGAPGKNNMRGVYVLPLLLLVPMMIGAVCEVISSGVFEAISVFICLTSAVLEILLIAYAMCVAAAKTKGSRRTLLLRWIVIIIAVAGLGLAAVLNWMNIDDEIYWAMISSTVCIAAIGMLLAAGVEAITPGFGALRYVKKLWWQRFYQYFLFGGALSGIGLGMVMCLVLAGLYWLKPSTEKTLLVPITFLLSTIFYCEITLLLRQIAAKTAPWCFLGGVIIVSMLLPILLAVADSSASPLMLTPFGAFDEPETVWGYWAVAVGILGVFCLPLLKRSIMMFRSMTLSEYEAALIKIQSAAKAEELVPAPKNDQPAEPLPVNPPAAEVKVTEPTVSRKELKIAKAESRSEQAQRKKYDKTLYLSHGLFDREWSNPWFLQAWRRDCKRNFFFKCLLILFLLAFFEMAFVTSFYSDRMRYSWAADWLAVLMLFNSVFLFSCIWNDWMSSVRWSKMTPYRHFCDFAPLDKAERLKGLIMHFSVVFLALWGMMLFHLLITVLFCHSAEYLELLLVIPLEYMIILSMILALSSGKFRLEYLALLFMFMAVWENMVKYSIFITVICWAMILGYTMISVFTDAKTTRKYPELWRRTAQFVMTLAGFGLLWLDSKNVVVELMLVFVVFAAVASNMGDAGKPAVNWVERWRNWLGNGVSPFGMILPIGIFLYFSYDERITTDYSVIPMTFAAISLSVYILPFMKNTIKSRRLIPFLPLFGILLEWLVLIGIALSTLGSHTVTEQTFMNNLGPCQMFFVIVLMAQMFQIAQLRRNKQER